MTRVPMCAVLCFVAFVSGVRPGFAQTAAPASGGPADRAALLAKLASAAEARRRLHGFSVVLVQGYVRNAPREGVALPASAAAALADMKDFLPYNEYRLLDTQWVLGSGRIAVRLQGVDRAYDLELETGSPSYFGDTIPSVASKGTEPNARLRIARFRLVQNGSAAVLAASESEWRSARMRFDKGLVSQQGLDEAERALAAAVARQAAAAAPSDATPLIDTTFNMEIGETVVVGTSSLQGGSALIVLVTAVPR